MNNSRSPPAIHLLPLELLFTIFAQLPASQNIIDTSELPWTLSQASSMLRSACLASPMLWSNITIAPPAAYPLSQIHYLLPLALRRSHPLGFKIRLINHSGSLNSGLRGALDILLEHSSRWIEVDFVNLEEPALGLALPSTLGFSSMKSLTFSTHHPSLVARHLLYGLLHGSEELDTLALCLEFRSPPFYDLVATMGIERWQKLCNLKLRIPSDWKITELLTVLSLTRNLRRFSVSDYGIRRSEAADGPLTLPSGLWLAGITAPQPLDDADGVVSARKRILLDHLVELEIYAKSLWTFIAVLENIVVPSLEALSLFLPRQIKGSELLDTLTQLLYRSDLNKPDDSRGIRRFHLSSAKASNLEAILGVVSTHVEELVVSGIHELGEGTKVFNMLTIPTNIDIPDSSSADGNTTTTPDLLGLIPLDPPPLSLQTSSFLPATSQADARLPWLCPRLAHLSTPFPHIERSAISAFLLTRSLAGPSSLDMGTLPIASISLLASSCAKEDRRMVRERWISDELVDDMRWLELEEVVRPWFGRGQFGRRASCPPRFQAGA